MDGRGAPKSAGRKLPDRGKLRVSAERENGAHFERVMGKVGGPPRIEKERELVLGRPTLVPSPFRVVYSSFAYLSSLQELFVPALFQNPGHLFVTGMASCLSMTNNTEYRILAKTR